MNDEDLNSAVRQAFERQALSAPAPDGLLETVRTRSRRRGIRNGVAGVSVAAVAVVAVVGVTVAADALPFADPVDRSDAVPVSGGPGGLGADEIELCVTYDGERLAGLRLSWVQPGGDDIRVEKTSGDALSIVGRTARNERFAVRLDIDHSSPAEQRLTNVSPLTVDGRAGVIGFDPDTGERVLYFETGVGNSLVRATGDRALIAWAKQLTVYVDPDECES